MSDLKSILNNNKSCKSIWFMRQAGRYLPEFRKIRSQNQDFIKLCLNSELSSIITLQPINRFDLDSAIIFSDILMVPHALGQEVIFIKDQGPNLSSFNLKVFDSVSEKEFSKKLSPIYKAIEITRKKLKKNKSLICFVGAPWTLITYMINLKNSEKNIDIKNLNKHEANLEYIINKLTDFLCLHIENQLNSGADVVQIFDSWAGLIPKEYLNLFCYSPNKKIVEFCNKKQSPVICFPKGLGNNYEHFNVFVKPNAINIDYEIDPIWARNKLKNVVLQGGLDPRRLLGSEDEMLKGATKYIKAFKDIPYVFNLGHGLLPETDPDKVKMLIDFYRNN